MLWFWAVPLAIAGFLNVPLLLWGLFGQDHNGFCLIKRDHKQLGFIYTYGPYMLGVVYCLSVAIHVLIKLKKNHNTMLVLRINLDPSGQRRLDSVFKDIAATMPARYAPSIHFLLISITFPLTLCLAVFFCNLCLVIDFLTEADSSLQFTWGYFGFNILGFLNLMAFLANPLVRRALIAPPPSLDDTQKYVLDFRSTQIKVSTLDSDSEYGGEEITYESLAWADKQIIKSFINST